MTAVLPARRHQGSVSLGFILFATVLVAVPLSIVCNWRNQVIQEHYAGVRLRQLGAIADSGAAAEYKRNFALPKECRWPIESVCMQRWGSGYLPTTDETVQLLLKLPNLKSLCLGCERKPAPSPAVPGVSSRNPGVSFAPFSRLAQLENLTLEQLEATDEDVLCFLTQRHLKELDLRGQPITDASLALAERNPTLVNLGLNDTAITDEGLQRLAGLKNLGILKLRKTRITSAGLRHLRGLKHLVYLDLEGTAIDDDAVPHLDELRSLKSLNLKSTGITRMGVNTLIQHCERVDYDY
ncbi:leucine-rich repeat domain-containing protein [Anatilimnocola floriformis]|uniref:leucine-rich repeat domain-containing protein n=1 Tax=Anatilimnocola floriformis TaxID=2948575 RepID=UPI0020C220CA|nr:hypothetical protein [Anatilimnocola floriformis]